MSTTSAADDPPELYESRPSIWPDVSLFGVALIWGVNIPVMKIGLDQIDVFVFNGIRLIVSALALWAFAIRERQRVGHVAHSISWLSIVVYGLMVSAVYQVAFLQGVSRTTAGNTALIIATVPMWTGLLARVFLGEILRTIAWCGLVVALSGTVIVAFQKGDVAASGEHLTGNLLVLSAALLWSGATVYSRPMLKVISPMQLSARAAAIGLPVHMALGLWQYDSTRDHLGSVSLWAIIFFSGVLSSGLALPMWSFGVRHAGAAHAAIVQNMVPLVAIVAAWVSRGEVPTAAQLIGGGLIISGLVIMRRGRQTNAEDASSAQDGPKKV